MKLLSFLFVIVLSVSLSHCGKENQIEEKQMIRPVRYVQVFATGGSRVRRFAGVAQAAVESQLSFNVSGTVQRLYVKVGDQVKYGQLLVALDPGDYQLQVQQAEAALLQAKAQLRNAESTYERIRILYENNNASRSQLDNARTSFETTRAAVQATQKQLELAQQQVLYTKLKAPVAGAIAACNVEVNENVMTGQPVIILTSGSQVEIRLSIPEKLITQIKQGTSVRVFFDAIPGRSFEANVIEVGVTPVGTSTTFPVTLKLTQSDKSIRPGMAVTAEIEFVSSSDRERFLVPAQAVIEDNQGRFLYTVEPIQGEKDLGTVVRQKVSVGELTAEGLEIFTGLEDGDRVITAGMSLIKNGLKVRM